MSQWDETKQEWLAACIHKWFKNIWSYVGGDDYFAFTFLLVGALGYIVGLTPDTSRWDAFYFDIRSELIGIGVSVLIIANAGQAISRNQEKKRLILQMGSPDNAFACKAVRQLRTRGWLQDGSLSRANLRWADLSGANLRWVDLSEADLQCANLREVNLIKANLLGATLHGTDLRNADLRCANLSETYLNNADLRGADLREADLSLALYNKYTKWPEGFDPFAAWAVLDES